ASLALEQRAAQRAFQRMDGAVHADIAGVQLGSRLAQAATAHEGQKHLQLLQGQFFVDLHGRSLESMALDYDPIEPAVRKPIAVLAAVHPCLCRENSSDATQSDAECTTMAHPSRRDEPHARRADPDPRNDGGARQPPGGVARAGGGLDAAPSAATTKKQNNTN